MLFCCMKYSALNCNSKKIFAAALVLHSEKIKLNIKTVISPMHTGQKLTQIKWKLIYNYPT